MTRATAGGYLEGELSYSANFAYSAAKTAFEPAGSGYSWDLLPMRFKLLAAAV